MTVVGGDKVVDDVDCDAFVGYAHHHARFGHDAEGGVAYLEKYRRVDDNRRSQIEIGDFAVVVIKAPAVAARVAVGEYLFPHTYGAPAPIYLQNI